MTIAVLVAACAFGVSLLTLFAGFGLGTLLMPAFALFFPVQVAVASTAVVHAANSIFKTALLLTRARRDVIVKFGIPAVGAAFVGAALLARLSEQPPLATWSPLGREATITPIKLVMGILILAFAMLELVPALRSLRARPRWLPLGGLLSGFFGGLSGHQGALRAAFLSPLRLTPEEFAATQAVVALLVDLARIAVYALTWAAFGERAGLHGVDWGLVGTATAGAFGGALLGRRLLSKVTIGALHLVVGGLLLVVGAALATGLV